MKVDKIIIKIQARMKIILNLETELKVSLNHKTIKMFNYNFYYFI